jgi:hypothetical protein
VNKSKSIKNNQVSTVSVGDLMEMKEDYPIEGEKTRRCEPFWAASARRTTPSKGKSPHAKQRHRGHRGHRDHRDPAGVNRVGRASCQAASGRR